MTKTITVPAISAATNCAHGCDHESPESQPHEHEQFHATKTSSSDGSCQPTADTEHDECYYSNGNGKAEFTISIMDIPSINLVQPHGPKRTGHVSRRNIGDKSSASSTSSAPETTAMPDVYAATGERVNPDGSYDFGDQDVQSVPDVEYVTHTVDSDA